MDITAAEVKAFFAEFGDTDDGVVERAINTAYQITDVSRDCTMYCVGHLLTVATQQTGTTDGGAGVITSERVGPKMVMFKTQAQQSPDVFFEQTPYGRMVLTLETRSATANFSIHIA